METLKTVSSTNQKAKEMALKGAKPWTVVVAEEQTSGYGKEKVFWFSPKGGLYFSVILPKSKIDDLQLLTVLAAFAVAKTIKSNFSLEPLIKLPNDVLVNQRKIAGILTENIMGKEIIASVLGIGLNTNIANFPKELENIATSLKIETGREVDNKAAMEHILKEIKEQFKTIS